MVVSSGTALAEFADFVEGTGPTYVTGPKHLVNEAVLHTYYFGRLVKGNVSKKRMIRGGSDIRESLFFEDNGTFETYLPGATHNWKNPQKLKKVKTYWRFTMVHMSWTDQEILFNERITEGSIEAQFHAYVDIRNEKEALMWSAKWNGLEGLLFATPDKDTMEAEEGTEPYSLFAFVNEDTNGLFGTNYTGETWTTVEGLDPTVNTKFKPQQLTYNSTTLNDPGNIISMLDELYMDVHFERPPTHKEYFEDPRLNKQMILTTKIGRKAVMVLLRNHQDRFVAGPQDPAYNDPQFNGVPIVRVDSLETANLYDDGSNGVTTEALADTTKRGPRFYMVNGNYIYPVFHRERYFFKDEVSRHHNVPDTWVCPVATWYNLICTSRQRQGVLSPNGNFYY